MIEINWFNISNFRSFKTINKTKQFSTLDSINVLTGENNTGKTNVLRAINLFFNPELYDEELDRNYISKVTGGSTSRPSFITCILDTDTNARAEIKLSFNKKTGKTDQEYSYSVIKSVKGYQDASIIDLSTPSREIKKFLDKEFKVVYLSAVDDLMSEQADRVLNDMILSFYKKQNKAIRQSVAEFETAYQNLINNLSSNLTMLSSGMKSKFADLPQNFYPELSLTKEKTITDFLIDNFQLKINDTYAQNLKVKGSGVQRSSIILMNLFLVDNIYQDHNTIILVDEPEAFLYPTLVQAIKQTFQKIVKNNQKMQLFVTTHSPEFIAETNKKSYSFYNLSQEQYIQKFARSQRTEDIVKYSIISKYTAKVKNEILLKYGLLDQINNYENIILVEGPSDKNYLTRSLFTDIRPQIRTANDYQSYNIPSGTSGIIPILYYLDTVSQVTRNITIVLDGDEAGKKMEKKIRAEKKIFREHNINIIILDNDKSIEDYFFDKESAIKKIIGIQDKGQFIENFNKSEFISIMRYSKHNIIESVRNYFRVQGISEKGILGKIKYQMSLERIDTELSEPLAEKIRHSFSELY